MGLFSFLGNKKQGSTSGKPEYNSGSEENFRGSSDRSTRSKKQPNGATQTSSDTALPEKKRARRRLIGAVALVLAAIIVLPMLFDTQQKTASSDIAIQIPSVVDTPTPVKTPVAPDSQPVPNPPDAAGASSSGSVSVPAGLGQQEEFIALTPVPVPAPAPAPAIAPAPEPANTGTQPAPMAPIPETRHVAKPEPKPEPKPTPKQAEKGDESARARAILEGRSVTVTTAKTSSQFALQVAALTSQKSVDELQGKLKAAGIKSYTQKAGAQSGSPIRVRVGPFSSKEEAEKMHAKMVKLGFGGAVVPLN
ncbi:MAG: SPOR domain-containing protein [Burkholderiaceae bacterium]